MVRWMGMPHVHDDKLPRVKVRAGVAGNSNANEGTGNVRLQAAHPPEP
jgi:hypothetical protein